MDDKKRLLKVLIIAASVATIISGLSIFAILRYGDEINEYISNYESLITASLTSGDSKTNPPSEEKATWKQSIIVNYPIDQNGTFTQIDVTDDIPCFNKVFSGENVKFEQGNTPNRFVISKEGSNLLDSERYMTNFEVYINDESVETYKCKDFAHETILDSYAIKKNEYTLFLSLYSDNYIQKLLINYVPFPMTNLFSYDLASLFPSLPVEPIITTNEENIKEVKATLPSSYVQYFNYLLTNIYYFEDFGEGLFINKYRNTLTVHYCDENLIEITGCDLVQ